MRYKNGKGHFESGLYLLFLVFCNLAFCAFLSLFSLGGVFNSHKVPSASLFTLFFGSAIAAAVSSLIIGLDHLGLTFKLSRKTIGRAEKAWLIRAKNAPIVIQPAEPSECANVLVLIPEEMQKTTVTKKESK